MGAEPADRALLDGDRSTSWLCISMCRISASSSGLAKRRSATEVDRPLRLELVGRLQRLLARRVPSDRIATVLAFAHHPALADLQPLGDLRTARCQVPLPRG